MCTQFTKHTQSAKAKRTGHTNFASKDLAPQKLHICIANIFCFLEEFAPPRLIDRVLRYFFGQYSVSLLDYSFKVLLTFKLTQK